MKKSKTHFEWVLVLIFSLLAVSFIADIWGGEKKAIIKNPLVDPATITTSTVRNPLLAPVIRQAGFTYNCNNCHQHFEPTERNNQKLLAAHRDIVMDHGINNKCLNCHHPQKREFLTDINNDEIPLLKSELLCRKCHGAKFKDWNIGIHGKQVGYWDKNMGPTKKSTCVACHNPHSPKFKAMTPAPGPVRHNYSTDKEVSHHE